MGTTRDVNGSVDKKERDYTHAYRECSLPIDVVKSGYTVVNNERWVAFKGYASTPDVDSYNDIIPVSAWSLDAFAKNSILLYQHSEPIGVVEALTVKKDGLYVERGLVHSNNMTEEVVIPLLRAGVLKGLSVGFTADEYTTRDDAPSGFVITRATLREISVVSVPANSASTIDSVLKAWRDFQEVKKSLGIADTSPLEGCSSEEDPKPSFVERTCQILWDVELKGAETESLARVVSDSDEVELAEPSWAVGAARGLKVIERDSWDGAAARKRIFAWAGWPSNPSPAKAKKAFLLYDSANAENKTSYKCPFADIEDGELCAVDRGLRAAAQMLPKVDGVPESVIKKAQRVLDSYLNTGDTKSLSLNEGWKPDDVAIPDGCTQLSGYVGRVAFKASDDSLVVYRDNLIREMGLLFTKKHGLADEDVDEAFDVFARLYAQLGWTLPQRDGTDADPRDGWRGVEFANGEEVIVAVTTLKGHLEGARSGLRHIAKASITLPDDVAEVAEGCFDELSSLLGKGTEVIEDSQGQSLAEGTEATQVASSKESPSAEAVEGVTDSGIDSDVIFALLGIDPDDPNAESDLDAYLEAVAASLEAATVTQEVQT